MAKRTQSSNETYRAAWPRAASICHISPLYLPYISLNLPYIYLAEGGLDLLGSDRCGARLGYC